MTMISLNLKTVPTLYLIRGLPGSGKTTLAQALVYQRELENHMFQTKNNIGHVETDMYFIDKFGYYNFDIDQISQAHFWCRKTTFDMLLLGNDVIVSNTFTTNEELEKYIDIVGLMDIKHKIIVAPFNSELYQSIHNVPEHALEKMSERWEDVTGEIKATKDNLIF